MLHIQSVRSPATLLLGFLLAGVLTTASAVEQTFESAEAAVEAFVDALEKDDTARLQALLGPGTEELLSSGDAVQDKGDRATFVAAYRKKHFLAADGPDAMTLVIGEDKDEFPIPVVKRDGRWYLDGVKGADELVYRRIGGNELGAIGACRGFVDAQLEYAAEGRDGDPAGIYALKMISDEGAQNGLYWPTAEDEAPSPAGPFVAAAAGEGYRRGATRQPYHGYYYRLLYNQGKNAKGGPREYFRGGLLTEGFALVAWPADYQVSGVTTFIVNQDGEVFQKDLGDNTDQIVATLASFDPDRSWTPVSEPAD
jgi:hypothetical protein